MLYCVALYCTVCGVVPYSINCVVLCCVVLYCIVCHDMVCARFRNTHTPYHGIQYNTIQYNTTQYNWWNKALMEIGPPRPRAGGESRWWWCRNAVQRLVVVRCVVLHCIELHSVLRRWRVWNFGVLWCGMLLCFVWYASFVMLPLYSCRIALHLRMPSYILVWVEELRNMSGNMNS